MVIPHKLDKKQCVFRKKDERGAAIVERVYSNLHYSTYIVDVKLVRI